LQKDALPDAFWELIEIALQNKQVPRPQLESAVSRACKDAKNGTYLGCTLRFYLQKNGWPVDQ
jgi:hypothetical protein